ncbi:MAG: polyprenyl diphosphate synthase [Thermoplasmata archaeon]|nr:polyprenyl diphosphate synthase [Thermoplasmata archaeon]
MANRLKDAVIGKLYRMYEKRLTKQVRRGPIPKHVAVIMDGNRRFAEEMGLGTFEGHQAGKDKLEEMLNWCMEFDIKVLTVFAFSTENLLRDQGEVNYLMDMFEENFKNLAEDPRVHKYKIRVRGIGQRLMLPERIQKAIEYAEIKTKEYDRYFFNLAIAYGGREEILHAIKKIAERVKKGEMKIDDISEDTFSSMLYTKDLPDPDLILRTSGEERISNFLLWQLAYSEFYFTDVYWPGLRKIDFLRAIRSYQGRIRRYGA